jgi:hypothetical protein
MDRPLRFAVAGDAYFYLYSFIRSINRWRIRPGFCGGWRILPIPAAIRAGSKERTGRVDVGDLLKRVEKADGCTRWAPHPNGCSSR